MIKLACICGEKHNFIESRIIRRKGTMIIREEKEIIEGITSETIDRINIETTESKEWEEEVKREYICQSCDRDAEKVDIETWERWNEMTREEMRETIEKKNKKIEEKRKEIKGR